jgi:hypothetical protein
MARRLNLDGILLMSLLSGGFFDRLNASREFSSFRPSEWQEYGDNEIRGESEAWMLGDGVLV